MQTTGKRILSLILCIAMVLSMVVVPAFAEDGNLLANGDFEGGKTGWSFGSGTGTNNNYPHSDTSGYHFYTNSGSVISQTVTVPESGSYVLSGMIAGWGELKLNDASGSTIVSQSRSNSSYIEMTMEGIELNAGDKVTVALDGGSNWLNGDDIFFGTAESWYAIQAQSVAALIDAIGEVSLDSKTSVNEARRAYDALNPAAQELVGNYRTLTDAEAQLNALAAANVSGLIDALGEITEDSLAAVVEARKAYESLSAAQKELVLNLPVLEAAEEILTELEVYFERRMTPVMGWSSWNCYYEKISESKLKTQIDALVSTGLADAGYIYFNIDDAWQAGRNAETGLVNVSKTKFPNGLKVVADYAHEKGLKAGIYSDAGTFTCASMYSGEGDNGRGVGLYGYDYVDLYQYFINWGFDFIKVDFCGGKHDPNGPMSQQERYTAIGDIIEELELIKGKDIIFNVCCWEFPGEWVVDVGDSWRVGSDITANFDSVLYQIEQARPLGEYHGPGHVNDLDMMHVGNGMTYEEDKSHFSMWCMMAAPLILGSDLTKMSEETLELVTNEELIAVNQDPAVIMASVARESDGVQIWEKPLGSEDSNVKAIAILNTNNFSIDTSFKWSEVGFDGDVQVRDLWEHKDLTVGDGMSLTLPAHGIVVLKVTGDSFDISDSIIKGYSRSIPEDLDLASEGELDWVDLTNGTEKEDGYIIEVIDDETVKVKAVSSERLVKVYVDSMIDGGLDAGFTASAVMDGKECRLFGSVDSVCTYAYTGEPGGSEMTISVNTGIILGVTVSEGEGPIEADDEMLLSNSSEEWNLDLSEGTLAKHHFNLQNNGTALIPAYVNSAEAQSLFAVAPGVSRRGANQFFEIYLPARETLTRAKIYYSISDATGSVIVKNGDEVQVIDLYDISQGEENVLTIWYTASDDVSVTIVLESMLSERGRIDLEAATLAEETATAIMARPEIVEEDGVFHITAGTIGQGSGEYTVSVVDADGNETDSVSGTALCGETVEASVSTPADQTGCQICIDFGGSEYVIDLPLTGENDPEPLGFIGNLKAQQLVEDGAVLLDVRSLEEFEAEHIDGAEHMVYTDILTGIGELIPDKSQTIVVYCSAGKRSTQAQLVLTGLGYENVYNMGAMSNWYIEPTITIGENDSGNLPGMEVPVSYTANPYEEGLELWYSCGKDTGFTDAEAVADGKAIVDGDGCLKVYLTFEGQVVKTAEKQFKLLFNAPIPEVEIDVYMSDIVWLKNESSVAAAKKDKSYDGNSLNIAGIDFPKGIGAHAPSVIEAKIPEGMTRFIAVAGADNEVGPSNPSASSEIRKTQYFVYIDDVLMDESLEMPVGYYHVFDIRIPEGTSTIRLEIDDTEDLQYHDHADWGIAGFVAWEYPVAEEIILSQTEAEIEIGQTLELTAQILPEDAESVLTWASSDETVATVDNGVVTAIAEGTVTITATADNGVTAQCEITVVDPFIEVSEITLDKTEAEMSVGGELTLTADIKPDDATDKTVTWSSSDESVATVDGGVVTALHSGTVTITAATGDVTAECVITVSFPNPFEDVKDKDYFFTPVLWAVEEGITKGATLTTFEPEVGCTRAQVVTFLYRAAGEPAVEGENPFTDVEAKDYYYNAVLWAVTEGITKGTTATTFEPDETCSRAQIVAFLYRYAGEPEVEGENPFIDVEADEYYYNAVLWASQNEITQGDGAQNTFNPDGKCERCQIVTFLYRYMVE